MEGLLKGMKWRYYDIFKHSLLSSDTGFQVLTPTEVAAAEEGKDPEQFGFDVGFCDVM